MFVESFVKLLHTPQPDRRHRSGAQALRENDSRPPSTMDRTRESSPGVTCTPNIVHQMSRWGGSSVVPHSSVCADGGNAPLCQNGNCTQPTLRVGVLAGLDRNPTARPMLLLPQEKLYDSDQEARCAMTRKLFTHHLILRVAGLCCIVAALGGDLTVVHLRPPCQNGHYAPEMGLHTALADLLAGTNVYTGTTAVTEAVRYEPTGEMRTARAWHSVTPPAKRSGACSRWRQLRRRHSGYLSSAENMILHLGGLPPPVPRRYLTVNITPPRCCRTARC